MGLTHRERKSRQARGKMRAKEICRSSLQQFVWGRRQLVATHTTVGDICSSRKLIKSTIVGFLLFISISFLYLMLLLDIIFVFKSNDCSSDTHTHASLTYVAYVYVKYENCCKSIRVRGVHAGICRAAVVGEALCVA